MIINLVPVLYAKGKMAGIVPYKPLTNALKWILLAESPTFQDRRKLHSKEWAPDPPSFPKKP